MNRMGYPLNLKNEEEWNSKLKEMIEKFEILINRSIEDQVDLSKAGFEKESRNKWFMLGHLEKQTKKEKQI